MDRRTARIGIPFYEGDPFSVKSSFDGGLFSRRTAANDDEVVVLHET